MTHALTVWVDGVRCKGCGECLEVCRDEAIVLFEGQARVDETKCTGCRACVDVCPEGAIQPVMAGELVSALEHPSPAVRRPGLLAQTVGAPVAFAGMGLLMKAVGALARAGGRWLTQRSLGTRPSAGIASGDRGGAGGGRRTRHRRRGG